MRLCVPLLLLRRRRRRPCKVGERAVTRAWDADMRAGFKGVLMKPFTREKLRDTLLAHGGSWHAARFAAGASQGHCAVSQ